MTDEQQISADYGTEPNTDCPRCGGEGWLWDWASIIGFSLLGSFFIGAWIAWFKHVIRGGARTSSTRGGMLAIPMGLVCWITAYQKRWRRCACNPKPKKLPEDTEDNLID